MALNRWIAAAPAVAQVDSVTPGTVAAGNIFTVTIGNRSVSFTATAGTVANVTAGLLAAISTAGLPEFARVAASDVGTALLLTANTAGVPFTATASAAAGTGGGSPTNTRAAVTANRSPSDWSDAANWSLGAVPVSTNDVVFDAQSNGVPALYGLNQAGVTLASLTVTAGYTGAIGLAAWNPDGYAEYLTPQALTIGATAVNIGEGSGSGPYRVRLNLGSVQSTINVFGSGTPRDANVPAVLVVGTHASNVLNRTGGSVGVAFYQGEVATLALNVASAGGDRGGAAVRLGAGVTLGATHVSGGEVVTASTPASAVVEAGGKLTLQDAAGVTGTVTVGGTLASQSTGTIGTLAIQPGGVADFSGDLRAQTVTNCTVYKGATLRDPYKRVTLPGVVLPDGGPTTVALDIGTGMTVTRS